MRSRVIATRAQPRPRCSARRCCLVFDLAPRPRPRPHELLEGAAAEVLHHLGGLVAQPDRATATRIRTADAAVGADAGTLRVHATELDAVALAREGAFRIRVDGIHAAAFTDSAVADVVARGIEFAERAGFRAACLSAIAVLDTTMIGSPVRLVAR